MKPGRSRRRRKGIKKEEKRQKEKKDKEDRNKEAGKRYKATKTQAIKFLYTGGQTSRANAASLVENFIQNRADQQLGYEVIV